MIIPAQRLTRKERKWFSGYIRNTPVGWISLLIDNRVPVFHGEMGDFGHVKTIFDFSKRSKRPGKKTVAYAAHHMVREKNHREKILKYTKLVLLGEMEMVITVVRTVKGEVICDGNHRAIAAYRAGRKRVSIYYVDMRYPA